MTNNMAREIVKKLILQNPRAFETAPREAQTNEEFVLELIEENATIMEYVNKDLRYNADFVLKAVARNPRAFWHAPMSLQQDEKIIVGAVAKYGADLRETSKDKAPTMSYYMRVLASSRTAIEELREEIEHDRENFAAQAKLREDALNAKIAELTTNVVGSTKEEEPSYKKFKTDNKGSLGAWESIEQNEGLCSQALHLECLRVNALQTKLDDLAQLAREAGVDQHRIAQITARPLTFYESTE
mmetsp:Transcript_17875/g.26831  ORF Transcript_17875/g.26831 Transcript_17875/m.26831 type:complete len:243 (-) Transcript_17875:916-1644(-)